MNNWNQNQKKMAKSMSEIYLPAKLGAHNNNGDQDKTDDNFHHSDEEKFQAAKSPITKHGGDAGHLGTLAQIFKHQSIASSEDICAIRKLLTIERQNIRDDERKFWSSDYERMMHDDWLVTRFLLRGRKASEKLGDPSRAHSQTIELIKLCAKFRHEYKINANTKECEFPFEWTKRNGIFSYKPDLAGNPVLYLRANLHRPKLIETMELRHQFKRLFLYHLERCDQDLTNNLGKGICCVFDMSRATFENVDFEILSWMIKSFKGCSPKLLCYVIVYNLPWFFGATLKLIAKTLMSNSNKQCLKFVYGNEILNFISLDNLPNYISDSLKGRQ